MAKIILVITGSVAAYKGLALYETLKKDHHVELILTQGAVKFLKTIPPTAKTEIFTQQYYDKNVPSEHITIAAEADLFIVYPATQNFIAQMTHGFTDSLGSLVYSVVQSHKMVFPAMNSGMYLSPANLRNLRQLTIDGVQVYEPRSGMLACNTIGIGRAWEWADVLTEINQFLHWKKIWQDKKVMLNFGRTKTFLDDIRYLTNNSSGKMGDALHTVLSWTKCALTTIVGDCDFPIYYDHHKVKTNQEMLTAMLTQYEQQDVVIACAALNDYQVAAPVTGKIKKRTHSQLDVTLTSNVDVLFELGKLKQHQILIGFSAQTDFNLAYGKQKLIEKNLDLIVINQINTMGSDQNEVILLTKKMHRQIPNQSKIIVAQAILTAVSEIIEERDK
ncbi:bifunctional phosphopantothenoylcysteine decarboxylase/phosphopantothenate--cysteine ligase CoaBC [Spiroplasma sp. SV19]|uniref:bifunctional phosphopantothenoylcysteine decarboxylase/phosphopantothenate--cysteine ligase CoaBC n=1 Tax=Spiroplasma sp. SV19 TaxID=2570468 RepID=UPI0024B65583|nr:bifunctional phosphopantothenoylcysteine decarboxylase/phosphopantothenate--cysteine ligase CoaBC [Spiroplasma sp. SV19]WHQ36433.1 bifunctional phosphopantothenoylcysteine decarboxylase/phosphopantothenate--cysteine ligase CoaBC [Spiroplasma sp. SV19]